MDLESVKPERFICDCGGVGHFFRRAVEFLSSRRRRRVTTLRFYCMDCAAAYVTQVGERLAAQYLRPVNETEA